MGPWGRQAMDFGGPRAASEGPQGAPGDPWDPWGSLAGLRREVPGAWVMPNGVLFGQGRGRFAILQTAKNSNLILSHNET